MSINLQRYLLRQSEEGLASFVVTSIMIIVISLIVLGFGVVARRENQSALDRQLSTQAYYAAEAGVNDAVQAIHTYVEANPFSSTNPPSKTNCSNSGDPYTGLNTSATQLASGGKASYSCLLIFTQPSTLVYDSTVSKVINLQNANGADFNNISVQWQDSNFSNQAQFSGCKTVGQFPPSWPNNCNADVLRIDLVPAAALESTTPLKELELETFTVFLYPQAGGGSPIVYNPSNNGQVVGASCNSGGCVATIGSTNQSQYYMRVTAMYGIPQNITVSAKYMDNGRLKAANFNHGQAVIDVTGRAQNELRRLEVRTTLNTLNNGLYPSEALQLNQSICKKFYITPNVGQPNSVNRYPGQPNIDYADTGCSLN